MRKLVITIIFPLSLLTIGTFLLPWEVIKNIDRGRVFLIDKDGCIYSNIDDHSIGKYTHDGKRLLKIGRKGEGPGDIKRLGWFDINPKDNLIYVTEFWGGNRWISKFSTNGDYLGEYNVELDFGKWKGLSIIKFDSRGTAYILATRNHYEKYKDFMLGSVEDVILKFSPQGKKLKEIYRLNSVFNAEKGGKGNITIPFSNYLFWELHKDSIIVKENAADSINIINPDGTLKKKIPLPFKRERLTDKDLDEWESHMRSVPWVRKGIAEGWFDLDYWRKRLPFPEYKPVSGDKFFIDSEDNIFVMKNPGYSGKAASWCRVNLNSGKTAFITFPEDERLFYIHDEHFYFVKEDEDGDETIIKIHKNELGKKPKNNGK